MAKEEFIEMQGGAVGNLPNATFGARLQNGHVVHDFISSRVRMHFIRVLPGDRVTARLTPYDLSTGRITFRAKQGEAA